MSQFSRRHFQDIDIRDLIHHYRQYECLWDYNSLDYKNSAIKYQAWKEIAKNFNKDVEEVKRKIKYLRSAYVAERKKVEASKRVNPNTPYRPNLFYYHDLDFLHNIVVCRKFGGSADVDNTDTQFDSVQISQDTEEEDDVMVTYSNPVEEVDIKESDICKSEFILEPEPDLSPPHRTSANSTPVMSRAQKRRISEEETKTKKSPIIQNSKSKNLYMMFGKTMSLQLQQLPIDVAVLAMSEIHTILTKKTLEHIRSEQNGHESEFEDSFSEFIEETTNDEI
ncbi:uncharacterized protein ACRADG_005103 [Cochliomyia hominivorax]